MSKRQTKTGSGKKPATNTSPKSSVTKSTAVKRNSAQTTATKTRVAKSTVAKTTASKTTAAKTTASKSTASRSAAKAKKPTAPKATPKESVATLRTHFDGIVSRLKAADTNNRKNVKSLETAFSVLESQVKNHQSIDHAKLTKKVDQLSKHLTHSLDKTKQDIIADLKSALENPTIDDVEAAITRSEDRLAEAEMAQARSLSKINRHIADLARVIDARLKSQEGETQAQAEKIGELEEQVTSMRSQSYERIRLVENTAAEAMRKLGDEVVGSAESFQSQLANQSASLRERIEKIAARTQEDFDKQSTDLSRRMESIEDSQKNQSNYIDRSVSKLAARIDSLEFGLSQMPPPEPVVAPVMASVIAAPPPPALPSTPEANPIPPLESPLEQPEMTHAAGISSMPPPPEPSIPAPVMQATEVEPLFLQSAIEPELVLEREPVYDAFAAADAAISAIDAPTPSMPVPAQTATFEPPVQYAAQAQNGLANYAPQTLAPEAPQEYAPHTQAGTQTPQHHYVDPAQAAYTQQAAVNYDPYQANPETALDQTPYAQSYDYGQQLDQAGPTEFVPPIADGDLPYENPGYGEAVAHDGLSRPGHVDEAPQKQKRRRSPKAKLAGSSALTSLATPKNLRVAGLALAIAVAGYLGVRSFNGAADDAGTSPTATINAPASNASLPNPSFPQGVPPVQTSDISMSNPIGEVIPAAAAPVFTGNQSLEDAANSGSPIAEYQLGITYLDSGQSDKGLKYIRASANKNQPAAQYRLAKLYEAGIGVTADPDMARDLTERAARAGNRIAMHDLGLYYAEGRGGVDKNMDTALAWFEKAAERGVVDSQYNLGVLFSATPEIPKDLSAAYVWFSIASKQGDQFAANELGRVKGQLSAEQLKQADARVSGFKPVAIDEAANGIFREVPWSMPEVNSFAPTADLVRDAQSILGQLGYDVGTPDGDMGPKTRAAVKAFEKANGLPETGNVSGSLLDRLEAAAGV